MSRQEGPRVVREGDVALLHGLAWGAEELALLGERAEPLLESGHLALVPSELGPLVVLGPRGRRLLGLSPHYRPPPHAALDGLARRRLLEALEREGWTLRGRRGPNLLVLERGDRRLYAVARHRDLRARSLRRLLVELYPTLTGEAASLLVACRRPAYLRRAAEKGGGLVELRRLRPGSRALEVLS